MKHGIREAEMMNPSIKKEILENLDSIPFEDQKRVLDFIKALAENKMKGVPGRDLLVFSGTIGRSELDTMQKAIEDGCERVDLNGW
jgi:hypothetical protein